MPLFFNFYKDTIFFQNTKNAKTLQFYLSPFLHKNIINIYEVLKNETLISNHVAN